ncbi:MAG: DUF4124 domain-containing protein [Pseudomonadota bacterium]|jgi:hypothetical protein
MRKIALISLLACLSLAAHGEQLYKWVDSDGKVHYTDQPPPAKAEKKPLNIKVQPAAQTAVGEEKKPVAKSTAEKEQEFRQRRVAAEEAQAKREKEQADAREKERNCAQARGNLRNLQEGGRTVQYDAKGEKVYLDDTARQQAIVDAQKAVDSWCK